MNSKDLKHFPTVDDLKSKALKRIPFIAQEYLQAGTGAENTLRLNQTAFEQISLVPQFLKGDLIPDLKVSIFGEKYGAPFGIAPMGFTGLMWPKAEHFMAEAAQVSNIPFCLSTLATESPETIGPIAKNLGWFQLYAPKDEKNCDAVLQRAHQAGFRVLLITVDVPIPSRRERTLKAGLNLPPKITPRFIGQALSCPSWTLATLRHGLPRFRGLEPYLDRKTLQTAFEFIRDHMGGSMDWQRAKRIKDVWPGPVLLKGIMDVSDAIKCRDMGFDGLVISNHGGRQFDAAPSILNVLPGIRKALGDRFPIIADSGFRSGLDVLKGLAVGADFVLMGRPIMYGICALGPRGAAHAIHIIKDELQNNMVQLGAKDLKDIMNLRNSHRIINQ